MGEVWARAFKHQALRLVLIWLATFATSPFPAFGERLAVKAYTMADGLPRNDIRCIRRDSRGFLWFCTGEGLSRFDGYTFTNYGVEQGLPDPGVTDFIESRSGDYWVATANGLCRFNPKPPQGSPGSLLGQDASRRPMFEVFRPGTELNREITQVVEDREGTIWCATRGGLYRLIPSRGERFDLIAQDVGRAPVDVLLVDHEGALWIATQQNLLRRRPDGQMERYTQRDGLPGGPTHNLRINDLLEDRKGHLWVATWSGLCRLAAHSKPGQPLVERVYTSADGLPHDQVTSLFQSLDGQVWVGTHNGLAELIPGDGNRRERFRSYMTAQGFTLPGVDNLAVNALAQDGAANLWLGTEAGALRLERNGFTTYTVRDGLASDAISSIFEDQHGHLCVVTVDTWSRGRFINRLVGQRFVPIEPKVPASILNFTWGSSQIHFEDHTGAWWLATSYGLCRYPKVERTEDLARTEPEAVYTAQDGLPGNDIFRLYEDSRGDVWVSVVGPHGVTRWSRADGTFRTYTQDAEGRPLGTPISFREDRAGDLWMGFFRSGLARYRNGRFQVFANADELPPGTVFSIYSDHAGRLWLATSRGGLLRVDDPDGDSPRFVAYTKAQGLSSNQTCCITEDAWGRIYVGTVRGVDRLDPETGHIRHYTTADGLGGTGGVVAAFRDPRGVLWFGTSAGVSRLALGPDPAQSPPPIRIASIRLGGTPYPISELGETVLDAPALEPSQNQLELGFASLNFSAGEVIRYQYKLEGSDRDWSPLADLRTVNYASLSPGPYCFLVRAVNSEGTASPRPATLAFVILRPAWQRWWFLSLAGLLSGALAYAMYRYRLERLLEMERIRTRIATDLHDDIGSSLTQIAIMSEVARQQAGACESAGCSLGMHQRLSEPLARIADLSRGLVDSMSDVVWAINPRRDRLSDLVYRMRRFASDVFSARNIELGFIAPSQLTHASLGADVRRQVFLIFKESVNNIARHSECRRVGITLEIEGSLLLLKVSDDGRGFDLTLASGAGDQTSGHGLTSITHRAQSLGGDLHVVSQPGGGTCILLEVPLAGPLLSRKKSLPK